MTALTDLFISHALHWLLGQRACAGQILPASSARRPCNSHDGLALLLWLAVFHGELRRLDHFTSEAEEMLLQSMPC